jgi:hydroxymethylpyrimidine pyrophosphatase-like HAD family hydrolase
MRYLTLASDYDGTLAHNGRVDETTVAALRRVQESGRKLVLVTGRELEDLLLAFPPVILFDRVVAENGALVYHPQTRTEKVLGASPPATFIQALHHRGVQPLSVCRVIVATCVSHEATVLNAIRELGLPLQVIRNKDALMVLPAGVDKATGLLAALKELDTSPQNVVGVGDAENDQSFLSVCGLAVAVANALPIVKTSAGLVTRGAQSAGVRELIGRLLTEDLPGLDG